MDKQLESALAERERIVRLAGHGDFIDAVRAHLPGAVFEGDERFLIVYYDNHQVALTCLKHGEYVISGPVDGTTYVTPASVAIRIETMRDAMVLLTSVRVGDQG